MFSKVVCNVVLVLFFSKRLQNKSIASQRTEGETLKINSHWTNLFSGC